MVSSERSRKYVLFLGTRALSLERISEIVTAREVGYEIIMASDTPEAFSSYGFEHNIDVPLSDYEKATSLILAYLKEHSLSVVGVVGWQDREEELTSHLTAQLDLPTCSLEANRKARDKASTRRMLDDLGGQYNPQYVRVSDFLSFKSAVEQIGVPCILKPAGNSGGRGIVTVRSTDNLEQIWQTFSEYNASEKGGLYAKYRDCDLLEELVIGSEHSISGMVADGEIYLFSITDKRIDHEAQLQYENILPSMLSAETQADVKEMAVSVIRATGIDWRSFHIDFMVAEKGLRILEIGARLGGECINSHLIPLASSGKIIPYQLLIEYLIQGKPLPLESHDCTHLLSRYAGSRVIPSPQPGTLTHVSGFEKVCEHPNTRDFVQIKGIGDEMRPPTEAYEEYKVAYLVAECPFQDNIHDVLDEISGQVKIEVEPF